MCVFLASKSLGYDCACLDILMLAPGPLVALWFVLSCALATRCSPQLGAFANVITDLHWVTR